ncbi:MAG TPA: hypothetical protein VKZ42_04590 [Flavobacteriaceae bacterium]|nr:hypothetical protein [Flavobacteriaceae bacterium]
MRLYKKLRSDFQQMFYLNITLGIIASSCIGSIAAMFVLQSGTGISELIQLVMVVSVAMWYNASVLAQMKPGFVFNSLLLSIFVSLGIIIFHLIV